MDGFFISAGGPKPLTEMTMPPASDPWLPIRTERLVLRDFRAGDFRDVQAYAADPEVVRFMHWGPNTPEETRDHLARALAQQADWPRLEFGLAIEHATDGVVVGSIGLHLRDAANRTVEIGYCLNRDYWRRGVASEAARALVAACFGPLGLHRVFATCDVRNTGSFGVMEKLDMRREGCLLRDRQIKGEWRDTYLYAIRADEWAG